MDDYSKSIISDFLYKDAYGTLRTIALVTVYFERDDGKWPEKIKGILEKAEEAGKKIEELLESIDGMNKEESEVENG